MCGVGFDKLYEEIETKEEKKKTFVHFKMKKKKKKLLYIFQFLKWIF